MEAQLLELLDFLHDPHPQVRAIALGNLIGYTRKGSEHRQIFLRGATLAGSGGLAAAAANKARGDKPKNAGPLRDIKLLCRDSPVTAHDAFSALINLSDTESVAKLIAEGEDDFLEFLVSYIVNPTSLLSDLAAMLLSNLTKVSSVASALLSLTLPVGVARVPASTFPASAYSAQSKTLPKYLPNTAGQVAWFLPSARSGSAVPPKLKPTAPGAQATIKEVSPAQLAKEAADRAAAAAAALVPTAIGEEAPYVPEDGETDPSLEFGAPSPLTEEEKREVRYETIANVRAIPLLLDAFVEGSEVNAALGEGLKEGAKAEESTGGEGKRRKGNCHFLASVFANVTILPAGRSYFLTPVPSTFALLRLPPLPNAEPDPVSLALSRIDEGEAEGYEYPLGKLVSFLEHPDTIRRGGVVSVVKNCAFVKTAHRIILSEETDRVPFVLTHPTQTSTSTSGEPPAAKRQRAKGARGTAPGVNALGYILLPLCGPEEFDLEDQDALPPSVQFLPSTTKRERDPVLRLALVESLLLLCTTLYGRENLRARGVYTVVKVAHTVEKDPKVAEAIHRLVNILMRSEPPASVSSLPEVIQSGDEASFSLDGEEDNNEDPSLGQGLMEGEEIEEDEEDKIFRMAWEKGHAKEVEKVDEDMVIEEV
uniref:Protein HGH1 homolog n=1 Tax=Bartheletia paradoxa TaxID=669517 RepID=A0A2D0XHY7_9BASI|nr:hypothetical protein SPAR02212 [Bartheletia paradoxa]